MSAARSIPGVSGHIEHEFSGLVCQLCTLIINKKTCSSKQCDTYRHESTGVSLGSAVEFLFDGSNHFL